MILKYFCGILIWITVFHQGHIIYVSVFRESFLFFRKKNITNFFLFIILFVKCTYTVEKSCQILILQSMYMYVYICFICSLRFRIFDLNFKDLCLHFIVYIYFRYCTVRYIYEIFTMNLLYKRERVALVIKVPKNGYMISLVPLYTGM